MMVPDSDTLTVSTISTAAGVATGSNSNSNSSASNSDWVVVTKKGSKKRLAKPVPTSATRRSGSDSDWKQQQQPHQDNTTSNGGGFGGGGGVDKGGYVEDIDSLYDTLERCIQDIHRTDFYKKTNEMLEQEVMIMMNTDSTYDSIQKVCTNKNMNPISTNNDTITTTTTTTQSIVQEPVQVQAVVQEIVCYGIGNFSRTSLLHCSPSLLQLAYAICLQQNFSIKQIVIEPTPSNHENNNNNNNKNNDENNSIIDDDNHHHIPTLIYYDPCITSFEKKFLQTKISSCTVSSINERGNRLCSVVTNTNNNKDRISNRRYITIFYMPHCPAQLYENVVWSNWDNIINNNSSYEPCLEERLPQDDEIYSCSTTALLCNNHEEDVGCGTSSFRDKNTTSTCTSITGVDDVIITATSVSPIGIIIVGNSLRLLAERTISGWNTDDTIVSKQKSRNSNNTYKYNYNNNNRNFSKKNQNDQTTIHKNNNLQNYKYQCLQTLLPWLEERPMDHLVTKHDIQTVPGNIINAFNDTYISRYNYCNSKRHYSDSNVNNAVHCENQKTTKRSFVSADTTTATTLGVPVPVATVQQHSQSRLRRPYDTLNHHDVDPELR